MLAISLFECVLANVTVKPNIRYIFNNLVNNISADRSVASAISLFECVLANVTVKPNIR